MAWCPRGARAQGMEEQEVMDPITAMAKARLGKAKVAMAKAKGAKS